MKITGNTVLITGGASGIGLSLAKVFLENINTVIVCGRNIHKLDQVKKQYPGIHTVQCDVSSPIDVTRMVEHIHSLISHRSISSSTTPVFNTYMISSKTRMRCRRLTKRLTSISGQSHA